MTGAAMLRSRFMRRRLLRTVPTALLIVVVNFLLLHLTPGDMADVMAGEAGSATPEFLAALRQQFGLDQSLGAQFVHYAWRLLHFDLGYSFRNSMPVSELILSRPGRHPAAHGGRAGACRLAGHGAGCGQRALARPLA